MKKVIPVGIFLLLAVLIVYLTKFRNASQDSIDRSFSNSSDTSTEAIFFHPLQISEMRKKEYPGSEIVTEKTLRSGNGFQRYVVSYESEGLRIKGILAIPNGDPPAGGWPAIVFNHGYIRPETYRREEKYVAYIAGFASKGYVTFMPDFRGHQDSEGLPLGAYFSPAYTTDALNAFYSLAKYPDVNPERIGMWGHSMGGNITLRSMVVVRDVKAGVIWAGVVASYEDMLSNWRRGRPWRPSRRENMAHRPSRDDLMEEYGEIDENRAFWESISPIFFVSDISGPVQLNHGLADNSVPWEFSESLKLALEDVDKEVDYYLYQGADHNLSGSAFGPAMNRSVEFFDKHLKGD